nr:probable transmembrane GTPase FZO-like, chloroplastic isoform X1 [Tanacetum cinerariifolium]
VLKSGGGGSGRVMYDAACLLKAVIRDRAYFLVDERVDVATAVDASGVVLSDQGSLFSCFLSGFSAVFKLIYIKRIRFSLFRLPGRASL